jgi:hypothetical protein
MQLAEAQRISAIVRQIRRAAANTSGTPLIHANSNLLKLEHREIHLGHSKSGYWNNKLTSHHLSVVPTQPWKLARRKKAPASRGQFVTVIHLGVGPR